MWNWEQKDWPNFSYERDVLEPVEIEFIKLSSENAGILKYVSDEEKESLKIDLISEEAFKTSEIEGELLDRDSLQSSIRRQFGLKTDNHRILVAEQGVAEMMVDVYKGFDQLLTDAMLYKWHKMLLDGRKGLQNIGAYRAHHEPMQVVSGAIGREIIHFEAPPSEYVAEEMKQFLLWFNASAPNASKPLTALTRAGIAHLYFEAIHPFEDGNGRIGRAISEKALAQNLGRPTLIALAYTIEKNKKTYYSQLEKNSKTNYITEWLVYFSNTVLEAQTITLKRIEFIIQKSKLFQRLQNQLNSRQEKVLNRLFEAGIEGFKGGLSAENYISITQTTRPTATRDLGDLVVKKALIKKGQLKSTRYYLNIA